MCGGERDRQRDRERERERGRDGGIQPALVFKVRHGGAKIKSQSIFCLLVQHNLGFEL